MPTIQQPETERRTRGTGKPATVVFAFRAPRELKRQINVIAAQSERSFAKVCCEALQQYADRAGNGPTAREVAEQVRQLQQTSKA